MEEFWILILLFAINSLDKSESVKVKLEETPLKTFDEIFGEGWWDKDEADDLKMPPPTNFRQNVHHQIDRQNTQLGQIEPNSTDHNPPLTEEQDEVSSNENITENQRKRKIVDKFHTIKEEFKQKRKFSTKEWNQIEDKVAKYLNVSRKKIYKWKKELDLSRRNPKNERKNLVGKFDQMKADLTLAGFKNSYRKLDKTVAKELGLSYTTICNWKSELGQSKPNKYPHSEQKELMKLYYEIKDKNSKISDKNIAKMLKIGTVTLFRWKKQFERQQFRQNSVDGHSVEENAAENIQAIENSEFGEDLNELCVEKC